MGYNTQPLETQKYDNGKQDVGDTYMASFDFFLQLL